MLLLRKRSEPLARARVREAAENPELDPQAIDFDGITPLEVALENADMHCLDISKVQALLDNGSIITDRVKALATEKLVLLTVPHPEAGYASESHQVDVGNVLLKLGADPNAKTRDGIPLFDFHTEKENNRFMALLLRSGVHWTSKVQEYAESYFTQELMSTRCCREFHDEAVDYLQKIYSPFTLEQKEEQGKFMTRILQNLAKEGRLNPTDILLLEELGADLKATDSEGMTISRSYSSEGPTGLS